MKCLIVDDNKLARTAIKQLINQINFLELVNECESSIEAYNYLQERDVDLVFLDVEMPGMSGIELLKNLNKRPIIILVTAKKNYAVEAFELSVADYIIKPVSLPRFTKAVSKARELWLEKEADENESGDYVFIRSNSILTKVRSNGIIYLEEHEGKVNIQTADKKHIVYTTLNSFQEKLPVDKFYRVHNDYLVAIDRIDNVSDTTAFVGRHNLPIAEQYRPGLLAKLNLVQ